MKGVLRDRKRPVMRPQETSDGGGTKVILLQAIPSRIISRSRKCLHKIGVVFFLGGGPLLQQRDDRNFLPPPDKSLDYINVSSECSLFTR